jgi:hypothetical protein
LIDWDSRKQELINLLDQHDGKCIVPSSGGKDSTWQALTLLELGADVTVVTATTCYLTDVGRKNIDNLAKYAKTIEYAPDKKVRAKLNRIGLQMVGDISWPEHSSIFATPFRASVELGIPLVFYGENPQDAYGGPLGTNAAKEMTRRWIMEFGGLIGLRPADVVGMEGITSEDMHLYTLPSDAELQAVGTQAHFLGQYFEWDSRRNLEYSKEHGMTTQLPCSANWWDFENLDNAMHGIHDHLMFRKFGYGRGAAQISIDVRNGKVSREEAMKWIKEHDGLFPWEYIGVPLQEILDHIDLGFETFRTALRNFTNQELFDGEIDHRPILKEFAC